MPKITQQTATTKAIKPNNGSLLSRALPVDQDDYDYLHVSLYGREKTGKTRLAATFPKKMLIVGTDNGNKSIKNVKGIDFIQLVLEGMPKPQNSNWIKLEQIGDLVEEVKNSSYSTLVLDTANVLHVMNLAEVIGTTTIPAMRSWGMATQQQHGQAGVKTITQLRSILAIPKHTIFVSHESGNDGGEPTDIVFPTIGPHLPKSVKIFLNGSVDYVCQTFIRPKVKVTHQSLVPGGDEIELIEKIAGEYEYCLRTGTHDVFQTGFRVVNGAKLPDCIVSPTYEKIQAVINGTYKP